MPRVQAAHSGSSRDEAVGKARRLVSGRPLDGAGIKHLLRTVEELGYSTLWYPEALGYETLSIASFMLANTTRMIIGSSANIYARDSFTARRGLRTLSSLYDDRFILGLGVSHAPMVEGLRGHVYDKPVPTMRRYLDGVYEDPRPSGHS
jgi:alkanesulfonate monooxygenase SsuD/methylene tetrahydromethanopterin reductase-like flavin-dependent oxidoreductase (luciferase family)